AIKVGGERKPGPIDVPVVRHEAERGVRGAGLAATTVKDPLEHAHVLTETRPDELAVGVLPEPVDAEYPRRLRHRLAHREPMAEIIADVIAAKGEHRKGIATHFADSAGRGGSRLGAHR